MHLRCNEKHSDIVNGSKSKKKKKSMRKIKGKTRKNKIKKEVDPCGVIPFHFFSLSHLHFKYIFRFH